MTNIELRNIIIGSKDYEEEFVRDQLSVILEERFERESEEKIVRQLAIEEEKIARQHAIQQLRWESELNELRLEIESIRSNVKRTSCAEDRKKTSSNYRISIGRAEEHVRETSPAVLMAEATIPVTTPIKEEKGMDDLRVVHVKVKGEQEMVNAVIDTGAQMPVVRPDVVEGQSIDNRGSIQITSAFGEHEMGEIKDSNMELNDFRHGVVPVSKNLVNDRLICSSDYEVLIENSQMIRNSAKLREPSKEEGIISSTDLKSVCSEEVITNLRPETYTQSLLNVPNGDLVAVKINASNVQTNGQGIKESKREVAFTCVFKNRILYRNRRGQPQPFAGENKSRSQFADLPYLWSRCHAAYRRFLPLIAEVQSLDLQPLSLVSLMSPVIFRTLSSNPPDGTLSHPQSFLISKEHGSAPGNLCLRPNSHWIHRDKSLSQLRSSVSPHLADTPFHTSVSQPYVRGNEEWTAVKTDVSFLKIAEKKMPSGESIRLWEKKKRGCNIKWLKSRLNVYFAAEGERRISSLF
ncbi:hypothetical protein TNCV_3251401 [Trichonephila clavipes]|nr:hypothetical protein TNCV_3251401 [Trichonephila clavipes]